MTSSKTHSILSIDFGERYLGFAIKLKDESTIFPLDVLDTTEHELFDYLRKHIEKYDPDNSSLVIKEKPKTDFYDSSAKNQPANEKEMYFYHSWHGQHDYDHPIVVRPRKCLWDKIRGYPLRACMRALKIQSERDSCVHVTEEHMKKTTNLVEH